jgi:hypothetical protein
MMFRAKSEASIYPFSLMMVMDYSQDSCSLAIYVETVSIWFDQHDLNIQKHSILAF